MSRGRVIALYCSDVSGAFHKVSRDRLLAKLRAAKVHPQVFNVLKSWLRLRTASVAVQGSLSDPVDMEHMVYQGTVWGPPLWNTFFGDSQQAIAEHGFTDIVFADDLHALKDFESSAPEIDIMHALGVCRDSLHTWGRADEVSFAASKETCKILSKSRPVGEPFKPLGVLFDTNLTMQ